MLESLYQNVYNIMVGSKINLYIKFYLLNINNMMGMNMNMKLLIIYVYMVLLIMLINFIVEFSMFYNWMINIKLVIMVPV